MSSSTLGSWSTSAKDLLVGNHRGLLHLFRDDSTEGGRPALLPHETIKVLRGQLSPAVLPLLRCQTGMEMRPHPWAERTRYAAVDWNGDGLLDLLMTNNEATTGSGILYGENSGRRYRSFSGDTI